MTTESTTWATRAAVRRRSRRRAVAAALALAAAVAVPAAHARAGETSARGDEISRAAIAGVAIGDSLAEVRRLWGAPTKVVDMRNGRRTATWSGRRRGGPVSFASVAFAAGRAVSVYVHLPGSSLRTVRGDRNGTSAAAVRRHWPGARTARACCSDATYLTVPAARRGYLLVFELRPRLGLQGVHLVSTGTFRACFVIECD